MHHYKFTYFDVRGLGEVTRMVFAQAGVKYEDNRQSLDSKDWKAMAPFGQLPVLEVDHKLRIAQSCAIARYIARQHGLAGKTPEEEALVDSLGDAFKDFFNEARPFYGIAFGFAQGDKEKAYKDNVVPAKDKLFPALEHYLKESGSGFLVGKSVTWVDFLIAERLETTHEYAPHLFDGHPEIPKWIHHVMDLPNIKKWIQERPKNKF